MTVEQRPEPGSPAPAPPSLFASRLLFVLLGVGAALLVADAFYHKHAYFDVEQVFGFYGIFGFVISVGLILGARWLRVFLTRPEDFYDGDGGDE